ncbi:hypothetical protein DFH06DRAFT_1312555 [Mycena polygramma]|nr:hypothetical protein DFH06DRAFT_1312555 [Mycena polygramma]
MLSATLARFVAERDGIADRVAKYSTVLSPIRRIPSELVCEIFSWTLPHRRNIESDNIDDQAPWYLGHICRIWRNRAIGFPLLWRTLCVFHSEDRRHQPLASLRTQLTRAASAPLDINFQWLTDEMDDLADAAPLLDLLIPCSNRWESLRLSYGEGCSAKLLDLFLPAKGQLAQLKRLEFYIPANSESDWAPDFFFIAPHLCEVFLITPAFNEYSPALLLPWEQIAHYRAFLPPDQLVDILRAASNMVQAVLHCVAADELADELNSMITVPHLRRLHADHSVSLTTLTAPVLEYLSSTSIDSILPFLQHSSCHLTTLILSELDDNVRSTLPAADVISLLRNTPSLRNLLQANLNLHMGDDSDEVLTGMTLSGSADDLCPNLVHLVYGSTASLDGFLFIAMIQSRLPARSSVLSSVKLSYPIGREFCTVVDYIAVLRDKGFDASFLDDWGPVVRGAATSFTFA